MEFEKYQLETAEWEGFGAAHILRPNRPIKLEPENFLDLQDEISIGRAEDDGMFLKPQLFASNPSIPTPRP